MRKGPGMDRVAALRGEVAAFEAAARRVGDRAAPVVPSCPEWSVVDLVAHLGWVHRYVAHVVDQRVTAAPELAEVTQVGLPPESTSWPRLDEAPNPVPMPDGLLDWFHEGAARLAALLERTDPSEQVWTWSREQTVGFWLRVQVIEAAVHRWDAENAFGTAQPVDAVVAADAVAHVFEVMVPAGRQRNAPPPGAGERYRFLQTDGAGDWTVVFTGDDVRVDANPGAAGVGVGVEVAGTASDLMLFLWRRISVDALDVTGDRAMLDRYFELTPAI